MCLEGVSVTQCALDSAQRGHSWQAATRLVLYGCDGGEGLLSTFPEVTGTLSPWFN